MVAPVAQPAIFALRFALVRKNRAKEAQRTQAEPAEVATPVRRDPHRVSKKKKRRRRG